MPRQDVSTLLANNNDMFKDTFRRVATFVAPAAAAMFALAGSASAAIYYESQLATTTALFGEVGQDLLATALVILGIVLGIAVLIFSVKWGWKKLKSMGMRG